MRKTLNFYDSRDSADGFVGARIFESKIDFFFPLGMRFDFNDKESCQKKAYTVLAVLSSATSSNALSKFSQDEEGPLREPFNSFLWVLEDYDKNGLYNLKRKIYKEGYDSKINWKRTFGLIPFMSKGSLVYLNPISEKKTSIDNIITNIHIYCVKYSIEKIGWIFSLENEGPLQEISEDEKKYYRYVLLNELRRTFDDRRKLLLMHLLRVIEGAIGNNRFVGRFEMGTYKFQRVWEYMIQSVYGNLPLGDFFPSATWHLMNREPFKSSELRPDTVLEHDGTLYILDAKYYKYGVLGGNEGLPASDSVQKQITYGDHAALKMTDRFPKGIRNAFVVPFCSNGDESVRYAGYAVAGWRETERVDDLEYRKVHLLLLDTEYLIQKYQDKVNDYKTSDDLVGQIADNDKK